jgi:hypothetical protein
MAARRRDVGGGAVTPHAGVDGERPFVDHRGGEVDARQLVRAAHLLEVRERIQIEKREQSGESQLADRASHDPATYLSCSRRAPGTRVR